MKSGTPKGIPLAKLPFIGLCEGAPLPGVNRLCTQNASKTHSLESPRTRIRSESI